MQFTTKGLWQAITANILWGTTFLATHEILQVWGPITASALRFALASFVLGAVMKASSYPLQIPRSMQSWSWTFLTAVLGFGLLYPLQSKGLTLISTGLSALLMLTAPLFLVALSAITDGGITRLKWLGTIVGMLGGIVLITDRQQIAVGEPTLLGIFLTIIASFCLAASSMTAKRALSTINQGSLTFWSMLLGTVLLAPLSSIEASTNIVIPTAWGWVIYLAVACSVIAFFLWNQALSIGDPALVASTMHIKTPIAVAIGCLVNGEGLSTIMIFGGCLVWAGVWIAQKPFRSCSNDN